MTIPTGTLRLPVTPATSTVLGYRVTADSIEWQGLDWTDVRADHGLFFLPEPGTVLNPAWAYPGEPPAMWAGVRSPRPLPPRDREAAERRQAIRVGRERRGGTRGGWLGVGDWVWGAVRKGRGMTIEIFNTVGRIVLALLFVSIILYNPWPKHVSRCKRRCEQAKAQGVPRGVRRWVVWWDDAELRKIVRKSNDPAVLEAARLEWDRRQLVRPATPLPATDSGVSLLRAEIDQ